MPPPKASSSSATPRKKHSAQSSAPARPATTTIATTTTTITTTTTSSPPPPSKPNPKQPQHPTAVSTKTPKQLAQAQAQYGRGKGINAGSIKDKKLRGNLRKLELRYREAAAQAKDSELLHAETGPGFICAEDELEHTWRVSQAQVRAAVDVAAAAKGFELQLGFGPYVADYSRDGRDLLLGGRKGHVATFDWREGKLGCELQLQETVRDVQWLHNSHFFAVAQKKYVFIYDQAGVEIHCLKKHLEPTHMQFLPYHFLLATVGTAGFLKYQDTSTGALVAELRTKQGAPSALTHNRRNAVVHVGHANGTVTLWSPAMSTPLAKLLATKGPVRALAVDRGGYYLAAAGADSQMKVFDIRTFRPVHSYYTPTPASALAISDTGLLAVGWAGHVTLWRDALRTKQQSPYMSHHQGGEAGAGTAIPSLAFCPFDDILGAAHSHGFSSLIVPGAGEPNFDALEVNPYASKKARQEAEVRALLEKLRPEMIQLDPDFIGRVDDRPPQHRSAGQQQQQQADKDREEREEQEKRLQEGLAKDEKFRTRGKNSALRRFLRKKGGKNVRDERREKLERLKLQRQQRGRGAAAVSLGAALDRFVAKAKS